jgi:cytidylate kinase
MKKHIITVAGRPGSGKSTASKSVASRLGYDHFSSGDFYRALGKERGMTISQITKAAEKDKNLDYTVDERQRGIYRSQENFVIDARLAWHWMPDSFKVFLDLDLETAAHRIIRNMDAKRHEHEHIPSEPKEYAALLQKRLDSEAKRYKHYYSVDPYDKANYDLVIDTGANGPEEVAEQIVDAYQNWLNEE